MANQPKGSGRSMPRSAALGLPGYAAVRQRSSSSPLRFARYSRVATGLERPPLFASSFMWVLLPRLSAADREHAPRVLRQKCRPHLVLEGHVRQLAEDALERQAHRIVAGEHDLRGAASVGVVDDRLRIVFGGERAGRVVEVRILQ